MTHDEAFLQAILEAPDDDAPRLIYADHMDENGQPERAEFVRLQVALARPRQPDDMCHHNLTMPQYCPRCRLRRRERELLGRWQGRWTIDMLDGIPTLHRSPLIQLAALDATAVGRWPGDDCMFRFRRGFVEFIQCTAADFLAHADALTAAAPIREARLTTWPQTVGRGFGGQPRSLEGRQVVIETPPAWSMREEVEALLAAEWPQIDFTLPPVATEQLPRMGTIRRA